jgi:hypothetical protein
MKTVYLPMLAFCALTLSGCGAYVGDPPAKTEVHETTRLAPSPSEVRIYHD